jgi:hypothetical protein
MPGKAAPGARSACFRAVPAFPAVPVARCTQQKKFYTLFYTFSRKNPKPGENPKIQNSLSPYETPLFESPRKPVKTPFKIYESSALPLSYSGLNQESA